MEILKGSTNFNVKTKGWVFLIRHLIYSYVPYFLINSFELSQTEIRKWIIAIPFMYLMSVNDYNRLYTIYRNPLPIFIILVIVSLIVALFPNDLIILLAIAILFRLYISTNFYKKNMNSLSEKQQIIIISAGFFILHLFFYEHVNFTSSIEDWLGNVFEFAGAHFVLTVGLIVRIFKKYSLKGVFIGQAVITSLFYFSKILELSVP